jgi:hypothetical protein
MQEEDRVLLVDNNEQLLIQLGTTSSRKRQSVHFSPSGSIPVNRLSLVQLEDCVHSVL